MYIDAHAHLDKFGPEVPEVLRDLEQRQVFTVSVSMDLRSYFKAKEIAQQSGWVLATFGIHPWESPNFYARFEECEPCIDESPMIGEIGLDYRFIREPEKYPLQREVFTYLARKAVSQGKIMNLHTSGAEADIDRILGEIGAKRVIIHWYSGPMRELQKLTEKGFYCTVGVEVLTSAHIQTIAQAIPSHLLLTETDNPGGYQWLTGEPAPAGIMTSVVQRIGELRGWSHEHTRARVQENFLQLANGDHWVKQLPTAA